MNRKTIIQLLLDGLGEYTYYDGFIDELVKIICSSGYEAKLIALFISRLKILSIMGKDATKHKEFEPINDILYSMHMTGTDFNIRVLFAFLPNGTPVLLLPFFERAGKRKTDYTQYIAPALHRFAAIKEAHRNEF